MGLRETIDVGLKTLEADPKSLVFAEVADAHRKLGEYSLAIDLARKGVSMHPHFFPGKLVLARSLFEVGQVEDAESLLRDLYRFSPENVHILRILGQIYFAKGQRAEAKKFLKPLLELDPTDDFAREQLRDIEGRPSQASAAVPTDAPKPAPATVTLAKLYVGQGLLHDAKAALFEILTLNPDHAEAKQLLSEVDRQLIQRQSEKKGGKIVPVLETWLKRIEQRRRAA